MNIFNLCGQICLQRKKCILRLNDVRMRSLNKYNQQNYVTMHYKDPYFSKRYHLSNKTHNNNKKFVRFTKKFLKDFPFLLFPR